jgi:fumarylacetoacetate (FAA) hydrolase
MIVGSVQSEHPSRTMDGELVIIHPDRSKVARLPQDTFSSLRDAIDSWNAVAPQLHEIDRALRRGMWAQTSDISNLTFKAPLPRTWAFLDGSAFIQHVILVRKARKADLPEDLYTVPLMYQGASDNLLGPTQDIPLRVQTDGMDFESEVAVITNAVPMGTKATDAEKHILLVMLCNDVSLRELIPRELGTGFGFFHSKPPSAFSPFAVTPDELGETWREGRLHLPVTTTLNGTIFGRPNAGEMHFSFHQLIEHAAATRPLSAGTIIGSGTVSNKDESVGSSCLAEKRMLEKIGSGVVTTGFLKDGDHVTISVSHEGVAIFGSIDQKVTQV